MRIFLVSADEPFYIPTFLGAFFDEFKEELVGAAIIKPYPPNTTFRKFIFDHYRMYGFASFVRLVIRYIKKKFSNILSTLGKYKAQSVIKILDQQNCEILKPKNINDNEFLDKLERKDIDLIISIASSQIFKKRILELPRLGCINVHGSLLPKHRGINPSFWVLLEGDKRTGVTVHFMDDKIDTGLIILQRTFPVEIDDTLNSLSMKIAYEGAHALNESINILKNGTYIQHHPIESSSSYHSFPTKNDGQQFRKRGLRFF